MINRVSGPMWGNARQSAEPAKWAGKKVNLEVIPDPAARIRFYLHKEFRAAGQWGAILMKMAVFLK